MHLPIRPPGFGPCLREAAVTPLTKLTRQRFQRGLMVGVPRFFAGGFTHGLWDRLASPAGSFSKGAELMPPVWSTIAHRSIEGTAQRHFCRRQLGDKGRLACDFG